MTHPDWYFSDKPQNFYLCSGGKKTRMALAAAAIMINKNITKIESLMTGRIFSRSRFHPRITVAQNMTTPIPIQTKRKRRECSFFHFFLHLREQNSKIPWFRCLFI